jgi:hypothetical protein
MLVAKDGIRPESGQFALAIASHLLEPRSSEKAPCRKVNFSKPLISHVNIAAGMVP